MATFMEANKIRTSLKMKLSNYHWYESSRVRPCSDGYLISIAVKDINDSIKKIIPPLVDGVEIKLELA